jgi:hypothetical protein
MHDHTALHIIIPATTKALGIGTFVERKVISENMLKRNTTK